MGHKGLSPAAIDSAGAADPDGTTAPASALAAVMADAMVRAEAAFQQGVAAQAAGERAAARQHFEAAIALWPGCAAAWSNLGLLHADAGEAEAAQACYEQALKLDPALFEAMLNLATVLATRGVFDAAESLYQQAIQLRPASPAAWANLGGLLASVGRHDDALACCWHALQIDPGHQKARFNLSYPLLIQGRWAEGFLCLEARDSAAELQRRMQQAPRWAGDALGGRSLLVVNDAGHGDAIQMARYAQTLKTLGAARLVFVGQAGLQRLLADTGLWDEVLRFEDPLPGSGWDVWTPLMSLPYLCHTRLDNLPSPKPYLRADAQLKADWRERLLQEHPAAVFRIGLVWRGNPRHENDAQRSMPHLRTLAPLALLVQQPGIRCYSLQSGAGADEVDAPPPGLPLARLDAPLGDLAQTAALLANLDLVISVDTSMAHLAGALGVPVWVLLSHHKPDWRWLQGRTDSPWYPGTVRLFRQQTAGDWAGVLAEVTQALGEVVQAPP